MIIMFVHHHRSGTVRRSLDLFDTMDLAERHAAMVIQSDRSVEEIEVMQAITPDRFEMQSVVTRAGAERSMFYAPSNH